MYRIRHFLFGVSFETIRFLRALKNLCKSIKENIFNSKDVPSYLCVSPAVRKSSYSSGSYFQNTDIQAHRHMDNVSCQFNLSQRWKERQKDNYTRSKKLFPFPVDISIPMDPSKLTSDKTQKTGKLNSLPSLTQQRIAVHILSSRIHRMLRPLGQIYHQCYHWRRMTYCPCRRQKQNTRREGSREFSWIAAWNALQVGRKGI